jgi:hypothetical protein
LILFRSGLDAESGEMGAKTSAQVRSLVRIRFIVRRLDMAVNALLD